MENAPTSWEVDEIDENVLEQLRQYEPTEEEIRELEENRKPKTIKLKDLMNNITDYAEKFTKEPVYYSRTKGYQETNPLEGEAPYEMNNASFIYWCFEANQINLPNSTTDHSVRTIKSYEKFGQLYGVGSKVNIENLVRGDILLFNNDKHMGIHTGGGNFVSLDGPDSNSSVGGVNKHNIEDTYWKTIFQGHVIRFLG